MKLLATALSIVSASTLCSSIIEQRLAPYKDYLEEGTYGGASEKDWARYAKKPASRYTTFSMAFNHFEEHKGKIVVELGTSHSFVDGRYEGCDSNDTKYWNPSDPSKWDWGAGFFTRMAAEALEHLNPLIYTIDTDSNAIRRCRIMTSPFRSLEYRITSSEHFLRTCDLVGKVDLLYMDTGYVWPLEETAELQLREARIVVERNLMAPNGIILIDDVRNQTPYRMGDRSTEFGKAKYSIPYLLEHGFELMADEYQVILRKK